MYESNDRALQVVIAKGLVIDEDYGAARAWVFLMHNNIPRDAVVALLGEAARKRANQGLASKLTNLDL